MSRQPPIFADDPDASVICQVRDRFGADLTFSPVVIVTPRTGDATEVTGTWLGDAASSREVRVPLTGLTPGRYTLRLKVPGDNDVLLNGGAQVWLS